MDVKKAIEVRKSIRKFKEKDVPEEIIKEVIDAARLAPSSHNIQPWHFIVVKSKENLKKFKEENVFNRDWVYDSPVIIVCCSEKEFSPNSIKEHEKEMPIINLSLASSFLVLRATELGLGTCFIAWCDKEKIKKILVIPKDIIIPYVIAMGYPNENPEPKVKKELKEIMKFEKW